MGRTGEGSWRKESCPLNGLRDREEHLKAQFHVQDQTQPPAAMQALFSQPSLLFLQFSFQYFNRCWPIWKACNTVSRKEKKKKSVSFPSTQASPHLASGPSEVNGPRPYFLILSKGVCLCIDAHIGHEQTNEGPSVSSGLLCKDPAQRPGVPFRELWVSAAMVRQAEKITGLGVTEPGVEYWPRRFLTMWS